MRWWRDRFEGKAVICNLDKRKHDVVVVCPRRWQLEFMKSFNDLDVEKICLEEDSLIEI